MLVLVLVLNLISVAYFFAKRKRAVAISYLFAIGAMSIMSLLLLGDDNITSALSRLFGGWVYEFVADYERYYVDGMISPWLGLEILTLVIAFVITLETAESVYLRNLQRHAPRHKRDVADHAPQNTVATIVEKRYLTFEVLLC